MPDNGLRRKHRKRRREKGIKLIKVSTAAACKFYYCTQFVIVICTHTELETKVSEEETTVQSSSQPCCSCGKFTSS